MSAPLSKILPMITLGGLPITVIDRAGEAKLMIALAATRRPSGPLFFTSANGEVIARTAADPALARLFTSADQVVADGQPLVIAFALLMRAGAAGTGRDDRCLPRRSQGLAEAAGTSFYFLSATETENR